MILKTVLWADYYWVFQIELANNWKGKGVAEYQIMPLIQATKLSINN